MPLMLTLYSATAARSSKNSVNLFYQNVKYDRVDFMSTAARRFKNSANSFYQNLKYESRLHAALVNIVFCNGCTKL